MTSSGTMLGALNFFRALGTIGFAPMAGAVIDKMPRKHLMYYINSWLTAICLLLGIVLWVGIEQVWPLFLFSFFGGFAQAFNMPLRQTAAFVLVPRDQAPNAVAIIQTGWALMRSLGPAIGGVLLIWVGAAGNFLAMAVVYGFITFTIAPLNFPQPTPKTRKSSYGTQTMEGIRMAFGNPKIRAFLLMGWILPLFIIPIFSVLPAVYAKDIFARGAQDLGMLLSAVGVGGVVGGFFTTVFGQVERRGLLLLTALFAVSVSLVGFAHVTSIWLALVLFGIAGFFEMIYLTMSQTLLQLSIPDEFRGRITGLSTLNAGLFPVGAVVAGLSTDLIGVQETTILLASSAAVLSVIILLCSSTVREFR
jgi:predicted MFS family arabinose efflux permease